MPRPPKLPKNLIGPAIQRRRTELGWSQSKLAAECQMIGWDVSRGIVAALEGRVRWAGDFEVALLARVMDVPLESLFPINPAWHELGLKDLQLRSGRKK